MTDEIRKKLEDVALSVDKRINIIIMGMYLIIGA